MSITPEGPERATTKSPGRQRSTLIGALAFAAALIIGISTLVFTSNDEADDAVATTAAPSTTTSSTTSTPTTEAPATTVATAELFPGVPKLSPGSLDPGRVAAEKWVAIPFSFDAPDITDDYPLGWWVEVATDPGPGISQFRQDLDEGTEPSWLIFVTSRTGDDAADVVADLSELDVASSAETTIGGYPATQLVVEPNDSTSVVPLLVLGSDDEGFPNFGYRGSAINHFYVVDSPQGTLIVWMELQPEQADVMGAHFRQVIDSIEFVEG